MKLKDFQASPAPVRVKVNSKAQFTWQTGLTGKATLVGGQQGSIQMEDLQQGLRTEDQLTAWVELDSHAHGVKRLELYLFKLDPPRMGRRSRRTTGAFLMRYEDYVPGMLVRLNYRAKSPGDVGKRGRIFLAYPNKEYDPETLRTGEVLAEFTPEDGGWTQDYYLFRMDVEPCQLELF